MLEPWGTASPYKTLLIIPWAVTLQRIAIDHPIHPTKHFERVASDKPFIIQLFINIIGTTLVCAHHENIQNLCFHSL